MFLKERESLNMLDNLCNSYMGFEQIKKLNWENNKKASFCNLRKGVCTFRLFGGSLSKFCSVSLFECIIL